jgi:hypothetical protein
VRNCAARACTGRGRCRRRFVDYVRREIFGHRSASLRRRSSCGFHGGFLGMACHSRLPGSAWRPGGDNLPRRQVRRFYGFPLDSTPAPGHKGRVRSRAAKRVRHASKALATRPACDANRLQVYSRSGLSHPRTRYADLHFFSRRNELGPKKGRAQIVVDSLPATGRAARPSAISILAIWSSRVSGAEMRPCPRRSGGGDCQAQRLGCAGERMVRTVES